MARKASKASVVAFKVEEELAEFLNQLPNKSDFIRRAIYSQLGISCPLCSGTGKVTKEIHSHFAAFLEQWTLHQCDDCGTEFPMPKDLENLTTEVKEHLQGVFENGKEYCFTCYYSPQTTPKPPHHPKADS